jgi:hypothetical protein
MGARSVRGASVGDAEGNTRLLHTGPIVVGSNAMAGPSDTGICLEGNTTTGQVWKLPSVNSPNPTVGSTVPGMVYYDTSRNVARTATELGFLAVGQSSGQATIVNVSNTTAETQFRVFLHNALGGPRIYQWTERFVATNTSGGSVTYTLRFYYATVSLSLLSAVVGNGQSFHAITRIWVSAQGSNPSAMFVDIFHVMEVLGSGGFISQTIRGQTSASNINLSSQFSIQSTVQMSVANANASAASWGYLVEVFAG